MNIMARIFKYYRNYWGGVLVALFALTCSVAVDLITPQFIGIVVDCSLSAATGAGEIRGRVCPIQAEGPDLIRVVFLIMMGLAIARGLFQFLQGYYGEYGSQGIAYELRKQLYAHLQRLSFSWHDRAQTG